MLVFEKFEITYDLKKLPGGLTPQKTIF